MALRPPKPANPPQGGVAHGHQFLDLLTGAQLALRKEEQLVPLLVKIVVIHHGISLLI